MESPSPSPPVPPEAVCKEPQAESPVGMDGLVRLIGSDHFTTRMCMLYLFRRGQDNSKARKLLISKLHSYPIPDVEFYIPQLITLLTCGPQVPADLEQFTLTLCARSMPFALKVIWYLESDSSEKGNKVKMRTTLREKMEGAAINRALRTRGRVLQQDLDAASVEEAAMAVLAKDRLCEYYNSENWFICQVTELSLSLRKLPRPERPDALVRELSKLNKVFTHRVMNLPLGPLDAPFRRLIRVPCTPGTIRVLNSRERAPYLAYFEYKTGGPVESLGSLPPSSAMSKDHNEQGNGNEDEHKDEHDKVLQSDPSSRCTSPSAWAVQEATIFESYFDGTGAEGEAAVAEAMNQRLDSVFGRSWNKTVEHLKSESPFGTIPGWGVLPVIVKGGDDMRQEVLAMQLITKFDRIWREAELPVRLHPYGVIVTSCDSGIIELVTDAVSIDAVKKAMQVHSPQATATLLDYWVYAYGDASSSQYKIAQRNFVESMAAYSVVTYVLQLKDRHNANILLRRDGSVVHIDFGFMLSNSPGNFNFESMPFKLSQEYVDVMGGVQSDMFQYFSVLVYAAMKEVIKHSEQVYSLVEMMVPGPSLPCFAADAKGSFEALKGRLEPDGDLSQWVRSAIEVSIDNWRSRHYDRFQKWQNGIL